MGLFSPAYFNRNAAKREAALDKLSEGKLQELFLGELSAYSMDAREQQSFRMDCLKRIHDQQFLAQLIVSLDGKPGTSLFISIAVDNLSDDKLIYALLRQCKLGSERCEAARRLKSSEILRLVAMDSSMGDPVRAIALEKLKDPVTSALIARGDGSDYLRGRIAEYLDKNDSALADELARKYLDGKEQCDSLAAFGLTYCKDPAIKTELIKRLGSIKENHLHDAALNGFDDAELLKLCNTSDNDSLRRFAMLRLKSADLLWTIITVDSSEVITRAFYARLADIGTEKDIRRLAELFDDRDKHGDVLDCISRIKKCSREEVLAEYGTEATAKYYLARLEASLGTSREKNDITALRALYRAGKGRKEIEEQRAKISHEHIDARNSSCTPGWGHGDSHTDIPALRFDL